MRFVQLDDKAYRVLLTHLKNNGDQNLLDLFTKTVQHYQENGCPAAHTPFQPGQWNCPKCGADEESFIIEDSDTAALDDCNLLHKKDYVKCSHCKSEWTGSRLATAMRRKTRAN